MFDQASETPVDDMPQVLVATIEALHHDYGVRLETLYGKARTLVLYNDWLANGCSLEEFAKKHAMSAATFKRMLDDLLGKDRRRFNQETVGRRLGAAIYRRLQVAKSGMTRIELGDAFRGTPELRAATNHKVTLRDTLDRLERAGRIACDDAGRYTAAGPANEVVKLGKRDRLVENAHTTRLFVEAARDREDAIDAGNKDHRVEVTRLEFYMSNADTRERFYSDLIEAVVGVIGAYEERARTAGDDVHAVQIPMAVVHQ